MKFKSKLFCIATEGATTDGRVISADWIRQMAETFSRKTYGARVWLEHMRSMLPDGPFKAYGDVLALEARKKDDGKLGLFAQIEPTDELIKINKARQKIYTSIEINPDFANSGKAYLVGLAVTDSPASLGTDMLAFTQQNPEIEFEEVQEDTAFSDRMKSLVGRFRKQTDKTDSQLSQVLDAVEQIAQHGEDLEGQLKDFRQTVASFSSGMETLTKLQESFDAFKAKVEQTDASREERPPATGGDGQVQADC